MKFLIKTFEGLEEVLAEEVRGLGLENVEIGKRIVSCEGSELDLYRLNLGLHTAVRVLVPAFDFEINNESDFYYKLKQVDWEQYLDLDDTFAIDAVINTEIFSHSKFVAYRMKDAIVDWFSDKYNQRPSIDTEEPNLRFNVHIFKNKVSISFDSSGESLHKRGYRQEINEAPINEILAAGILKLVGYDGSQNLFDPMCGSGTFLIEAACIASKRPPCLFRANFGFMTWKSFDPEQFMAVKKAMATKIIDFESKITGADIAIATIKKADSNINKAKFSGKIRLERKDFFTDTPSQDSTLVVMNPPYGERIELEDAKLFYEQMGDVFKRKYAGKKVFVISSNLEALKFLGLKPSFKKGLFNGALECKLLGYEVYEGSKKAK
jgi:putative N6-adenine-specific DNA methylase